MATKKTQSLGPAAEFEVLSNLSHDNEDYTPGDTVELTEAQALAAGPEVVRPLAAKADPKA